MKIVVAGAGYVGLVTAVSLAETGHNVTCVYVFFLLKYLEGFDL